MGGSNIIFLNNNWVLIIKLKIKLKVIMLCGKIIKGRYKI